MKKICFIVSSPLTASSFLKGPIKELSKTFHISLIANLDSTDSEVLSDLPLKQIYNFEIIRNISFIKDFTCLMKLTYFFYKNKFDAIHSISPKAGLLATLAGFISFIPKRTHTFTGQVWHTKKGITKIILKNIDRLIVGCATNILVDGQSQLNFLKEKKIIKNKGAVLGNGSISGVELNRFSPFENIRINSRKKLKISDDEWVFIFLGRLNKDKGVIDLIKAFNLIDQIKYSCSLYLVGNDEGNVKLKFDSISPKVYFIPHEKKPEEIIQISDTFCMPSYREGFGVSVIEASALKKPIICSDTYGLEDTVISGKTGLKYPVGNILKLKEALEFSLKNKNIMKKMGVEGRKYVERNFNDKLLIRAWKEFYSKV